MEGEGVMGNDGWVEGDGGAGMGWSCRLGGGKDEGGKGEGWTVGRCCRGSLRLSCARKGMPVSEWDEFHKTLLEGIPPLRREFIQTRIVNNERAHFRGFASDTMAAVAVIDLFILLVFGGDFPAMDGKSRSFWHMFTILEIFRRGNPADLTRLRWEIAITTCCTLWCSRVA